MDVEKVWRAIDAERAALATLLAGLTREQWATPSACAGWTVQDVAAHVIAHPQYRVRDVPGMVWRGRGGFNTITYVEGKRRGAQSPGQILSDFERFAESRRLAPFTTPAEALIDALVHTQDIVRPLGIDHLMAVDAAAAAATRTLKQAWVFGTRELLRTKRLVATDADWSHGAGPVVSAPIAELLMLTTGRAARISAY